MANRCRYAFVIGHESFPEPHLIEISRRTSISESTLSYFSPFVKYCSSSTNWVLKIVRKYPEFFKKHFYLINGVLAEITIDNKQHTKRKTQNIIVETVIDSELLHLYKMEIETRGVIQRQC